MFKNLFPRLVLTMESHGGFLFQFMETVQMINLRGCKNNMWTIHLNGYISYRFSVYDKLITSELFIYWVIYHFCIIFQVFALQSIILTHCIQILESWIPKVGPKVIYLIKTVFGRLTLELTRQLKLLSWTLIWTLILDVIMTKSK